MSSLEVQNSIIEIIKKRYSSRTYLSLPIASELKKQLIGFIQKKRTSPFHGKARFELLELKDRDTEKKRKIGTYGFIKGAQNYIIGVVKETNCNLENFGYLFEEIILFATHLGLGTCWLGGTFKRDEVAKLLTQPLLDEEMIPAITPVGIPAQNISFREKITRYVSRSRKRKEWSSLFFNREFTNPLSHENAGKYFTSLEMVRLAPSASNAQPWRIIKEKNEEIFHFYIYRKKAITRQIISLPDFSRIDLGIAVCHFDLVNKYLSLSGEWIVNQPNIEKSSNFEYIISWFRR